MGKLNDKTGEEMLVEETKNYPTWKKAAWVGCGVLATAGLGFVAWKFGFIPSRNATKKVVEVTAKATPKVLNQSAKPVTKVVVAATKIAEEAVK